MIPGFSEFKTADGVSSICRSILQKCTVADLDDLALHMPAHVGCEEQAGVRLIHRIALRPGKVDEMFAVFQHLCASGLLAGLVCQMCRRDRCAGRHSVDADIRIDQTHGDILRQRIDGSIINNDIQISIYIQCGPDDLFYIVQVLLSATTPVTS